MLLAQDTNTTWTVYTSGDAAAAAGIGIGILLVYGVIVVASIAFCIWAIIDVNKWPEEAWTASGQNKQLWLILNIVGLVTCILLIPIIYAAAIRGKVKQAAGG